MLCTPRLLSSQWFAPRKYNYSTITQWYPRCISDLDQFAKRVLSYGAELDADHPGFQDAVYRQRRKEITTLAGQHRHGDDLPVVKYTDDEKQTWHIVYEKLSHYYPFFACKEYLSSMKDLEKHVGYSARDIPQIKAVSAYLKDRTGFTLRPVMGLLSSRDFLNALAFRVFFSTQYIRHPSKPLYTPEPDICHELLGHCPLFADPDFANFSQEIGIASLGASDEDVTRLATIYWFTVEFGLCKEGKDFKAYGAGLLSSPGELKHALSPSSIRQPFDAHAVAETPYIVTQYQRVYFYSESFEKMRNQVLTYANDTLGGKSNVSNEFKNALREKYKGNKKE